MCTYSATQFCAKRREDEDKGDPRSTNPRPQKRSATRRTSRRRNRKRSNWQGIAACGSRRHRIDWRKRTGHHAIRRADAAKKFKTQEGNCGGWSRRRSARKKFVAALRPKEGIRKQTEAANRSCAKNDAPTVLCSRPNRQRCRIFRSIRPPLFCRIGSMGESALQQKT